jgi:hypothetical protein
MVRLRPVSILLAITVALCAAAPPASALETDQFTVPDRPLPDIGPELNLYVAATVWDVVQDVNARADAQDRAARRALWPPLKNYHRSRAKRLRTEDYLARRVYDALSGPGLFECKIELWVRHHRFRAAADEGEPRRRAVFPMTPARGVYGDSPFSKPLLLVDLSPTVNVYGSYLGVDKLGHFFQQGYDYHREFCREESRGGAEPRALARAVRLGIQQERGIFGEALVGVYSNADLAANFAGLKFYLNLTRPIRVGGATLPPAFVRDRSGNWARHAERGPVDLFRPLVGDHFNEALNPSRYHGAFQRTVRANVRRRIEPLLAFYSTDAIRARATQDQLSTWHGEDYGHCGFNGLVTIADNCPREDQHARDPDAARTAAAHLSTR